MKFLILLAVSTLAVTAFYQMHLTRFESAKMKMIKSGTWKDYNMQKDTIRSIVHKLNRKYTQNITEFEDVEYFANITIGTPPQTFAVSLETTQAFLWVPDISCKDETELEQHLQYEPRSKSANDENSENVSLKIVVEPHNRSGAFSSKSGCHGKHKFDKSKSSTYVYNGTDWESTFGSPEEGLQAHGILGEDTVRFGENELTSLTVPNVTFGQAKFISEHFTAFMIDGILGLSFPALDPQNIVSPLFEAFNQQLIDPIFTVFLAHNSEAHYEYGGTFTYGGIDDTNCDFILAYEAFTSVTYYQIQVQAIGFGLYSSREGWQAILDTASTSLYLSTWVVHGITKEAHATYDYDYLCYTVECTAQLDNVELTIGGKIYYITPKNFLYKIEEPGKCCLAIHDNHGAGFGPQLYLGYPFLRSYCTIYDIKEQKVGFALPKLK